MEISSVIQLGLAVLGSNAITAVITNYSNKRKRGVETDSVVVGNIMEWATRLSARIDKLERELELKERQIDELIKESHKKDLLIQQLSDKIDSLERN